MTLKIGVLFILKAVAYGVGLAFGFFIVGFFTEIFQHYASLWVNDRNAYHKEMKLCGFNPIKHRYLKFEDQKKQERKDVENKDPSEDDETKKTPAQIGA